MHFGLITNYLGMFKSGLYTTLLFTVCSLILAMLLGILLAVLKMSNRRVISAACQFYTSLFRGIPLMVQLFLVYFATPQVTDIRLSAFTAGVITFSLNGAATISEVLRGGILAVSHGQYEAAEVLGVSYIRTMKDIVFPQALKATLPALINESIMMLKNSSLISTIGVLDVLRTAQTIQSLTYVAFEPLIIAAALYYVIVMLLTYTAGKFERRIRIHGI